MNTIQKNTNLFTNINGPTHLQTEGNVSKNTQIVFDYTLPTSLPESGFKAFKKRLEEQIISAGYGMFDETDENVLRKLYREGENETFILSLLGYSWN